MSRCLYSLYLSSKLFESSLCDLGISPQLHSAYIWKTYSARVFVSWHPCSTQRSHIVLYSILTPSFYLSALFYHIASKQIKLHKLDLKPTRPPHSTTRCKPFISFPESNSNWSQLVPQDWYSLKIFQLVNACPKSIWWYTLLYILFMTLYFQKT